MVLDRVRQYLGYKNLNFNKFEKSIQVSHGSISTAWKHKKNVGSNVIVKILDQYPELSAEWLLRGHGEMLIDNASPDRAAPKKEPYDDGILVAQALRFFKLQTRRDLHEMLSVEATTDADTNAGAIDSLTPFERAVIRAWEKKYGQELKSIQHQLSSFFSDKLERERNADNQSRRPKVI